LSAPISSRKGSDKMGQGPSQHCLQDLLDQQCLDKRSSVLVKEGRANNRTARREVQHETQSPTNLNSAMLSGRHTRATLPFGRVTDKLLQKVGCRAQKTCYLAANHLCLCFAQSHHKTVVEFVRV
jgi:hypothetical protein